MQVDANKGEQNYHRRRQNASAEEACKSTPIKVDKVIIVGGEMPMLRRQDANAKEVCRSTPMKIRKVIAIGGKC